MKKSKAFKISSILIIILIIAFGTTFIPTLQLKTKNMKVIIGRWVDVYYEKEESAASDCFNLAEQKAKYLMDKLGIKEKSKIKIFIYDKQSTFQTKKYGLITLLFNLDWYIGDNIGSTVILTSPANPGRLHTYESVKQSLLHEMVHTYEYLINPKMKKWLKEGVALYLTNGGQLKKGALQNVKIPSFEDIQTENPIKFANIGGYIFADTYIQYLDKKYGWNKVLQLL
ncbi:hypothetical protein [Anaerocellum danielii]|uniref:DUF4157 domain-containing protein n=1 Tax=Anaerocellum danielii TaxID=1387557 RepID=A0ABZ0U0L1_9FIRM|nr:hypothetical protein [Caldicellulosiruptor danielii]WPX09263.1 hypothetical protein SOJ16_000457 [Caldicellulosiruptor danielii]